MGENTPTSNMRKMSYEDMGSTVKNSDEEKKGNFLQNSF